MNFLIDFDGTITTEDVTDKLLELYADKSYLQIEQDWIDGKISSKECMASQYELIHANHQDLIEVLEHISFDPYFVDFCKELGKNNRLFIVSDGIDYPINFLLKQCNLECIESYSNKLNLNEEGRVSLSFPYYSENCIERSGMCKCQQMRLIKERHPGPTVLIGNGKSDTCLSHFVDVVFAKEGLLVYCQQHNILCYSFENFRDIMHHFIKINTDAL